MRAIVDWKRLLLALPVLVVLGAALYLLTDSATPSDATPRASLTDTPAVAGDSVGVQRNQLARDFSGSAPDGSATRLSDLRGRPTIINFWATWCGSCLAELPDFKDVQRELGVENLNVVAVNTGEEGRTAQRFIDDLELDTFRIVLDPTLVVADAYGVFGMPTTLFLDEKGVVRARYTGHLSKDLMREYVAAARTKADAGEPPPDLRLITTVAREHTLEVARLDGGRVEFRSKSLRCDDSYCSEPAIARFAESAGVTAVERRLTEDPPAIIVEFDAERTDVAALSEALAAALNALGDPLYERPLEIVEAD